MYIIIDDDDYFPELVFELKPTCKLNLVKKVVVKLHPNSCLFVPLSTDRNYTHRTHPSQTNIKNRPVRLGYVMRVSKQMVYYDDSHAYLLPEDGAILEIGLQKLKCADAEMSAEIKKLYLQENKECETPDYSNVLEFTLNEGDLVKPIIL